MENQYYEELQKFRKLSKLLIKKGGTYIVILVNHELTRFLYPYEPYENFDNTVSPLKVILNKIILLNQYLEISLNNICFYKLDLNLFRNDLKKRTLEKKTSDIYTSLWKEFNIDEIIKESKVLIKNRIPKNIIENKIKNKVVLDMGCGSGRYSVALSLIGAKKVYAVDLFSQSYKEAEEFSKKNKLNIEFLEANFHNLPFEDEKFDFIFSNGTLHHSSSIINSLKEYKRVLKNNHSGFLYLYAEGGVFWNTRKIMRKIFKNIPIEYTNQVLKVIGMPSNRFFFADVWHVPIETHTSKKQLVKMFNKFDFDYEKIISKNRFDLDYALSKNINKSNAMWGDGEHRYILTRKK